MRRNRRRFGKEKDRPGQEGHPIPVRVSSDNQLKNRTSRHFISFRFCPRPFLSPLPFLLRPPSHFKLQPTARCHPHPHFHTLHPHHHPASPLLTPWHCPFASGRAATRAGPTRSCTPPGTWRARIRRPRRRRALGRWRQPPKRSRGSRACGASARRWTRPCLVDRRGKETDQVICEDGALDLFI
jgi:hypothetical protein